jgi:hypothetical protein
MEHGVYGADGRQLDIVVLAADLLADLRSPPARVLTLNLKNQLLDLDRQLATLTVGSPGSIRECLKP